MAKDPVMKQVAASREKKGPNRPVNDEEKAQLGTRAELRAVTDNTGFWKVLEKGDLDWRKKYSWSREQGGILPPWFPDLDECKRCTIGAAYAKSRYGYTLRDVTLVCTNQEHYQEKLQAGEAAYREKTQAHQKGIDRQDAKSDQEPSDRGAGTPRPTTLAWCWPPRWSLPTLRWPGPIRWGSTTRTGATSRAWAKW